MKVFLATINNTQVSAEREGGVYFPGSQMEWGWGWVGLLLPLYVSFDTRTVTTPVWLSVGR